MGNIRDSVFTLKELIIRPRTSTARGYRPRNPQKKSHPAGPQGTPISEKHSTPRLALLHFPASLYNEIAMSDQPTPPPAPPTEPTTDFQIGEEFGTAKRNLPPAGIVVICVA